jgi:hypothetical protein
MNLKRLTRLMQDVREVKPEMERFLRGHWLQTVKQQFVAAGEDSVMEQAPAVFAPCRVNATCGSWHTAAAGRLALATHWPKQ